MSEIISPKKLAGEGAASYKRGDYLSAAASFRAAGEGYKTANDPLNVAEMANNASVALLAAGDAAGALSALEGAEETFAAAGDVRRQGMTIGNRASALDALERVDEAILAYRQAAELLQQAGEDQLRANVMHSLSALQYRTGRQFEALASMKNGVDGVHKPSPKQKLLKRLLNIPFEMMNKK
jgi:tetratricopeptide (TPR) repeat protein